MTLLGCVCVLCFSRAYVDGGPYLNGNFSSGGIFCFRLGKREFSNKRTPFVRARCACGGLNILRFSYDTIQLLCWRLIIFYMDSNKIINNSFILCYISDQKHKM